MLCIVTTPAIEKTLSGEFRHCYFFTLEIFSVESYVYNSYDML